jgi:protocatechuate 3,4-dioxygenase beta subunit
MGRVRLPAAAAAILFTCLVGRARGAPEGALVVVVTAEPGGAALAGAEVQVWNEARVWHARTGEDGRVRVAGLPAGAVSVYAAAEGRTASEREQVEVPEASEGTVALALGPGVPFDGSVLGADGKPATFADVLVEAGGTSEGVGEAKPDAVPYARTRTDAEGRFHVRGMPPGAPGTVVVRSAGHAEARVGVRAADDGVGPKPLEIRLEPGSRVRGTVRDPKGAPFPGALVFVVPADDLDLRTNPRRVRTAADGALLRALTTVAEADGTYALDGLPVGRAVVVCAEGDPHAVSAWAGPLTAPRGEPELQADLRLRHHAILLLRVQDAKGVAVDGAEVEPLGARGGGKARQVGMGRLELDGLWPGEQEVRVTKPGFLRARVKVVLAEGERKEHEVVLVPAATISGVLLDERGKPRAGVRVEVECKEPEPPGERHEVPAGRAETDAQGRFVLSGLRPGQHVLTVHGENLDLPAPLPVRAPAADVKVRVRPRSR